MYHVFLFADSDRNDENGSGHNDVQLVGADGHRGPRRSHHGRGSGSVRRHQLRDNSHIRIGRRTRSLLLEHKRK